MSQSGFTPPGVIATCECGGQFQLPPGGVSRVVCPHCRLEVLVEANGRARHLSVAQAVGPYPPGGAAKSSGGFRNPAPVIIGIAVASVVGLGLLTAVCGGLIYVGARSQSLARSASSATTLPTVAKVAIEAPPPRELVLNKDYESAGARVPKSPGRELRLIADQLKQSRQFQEAEKTYLKALEADPKYANAAYQLACNYVLWGRAEEGQKWFDKAIEMGFSDYDVCVNDEELGSIRYHASFGAQLEKIKKRYYEEREKFLGAPVLFEPEGESKGLIILLHGYGDSHEAYFDQALAWNKLGFRAVALPGSIPWLDGSYHWSDFNFDVTHQAVQKVLADPLVAQKQEKVYLLGFSQGGAHAMGLVMQHPETYAGGVILSPGGNPRPFENDGRLKLQGQGCLYFVYGSQEPHGQVVPLWQVDCTSAGWRSEVLVHEGGHHFPRDWDEKLPAVARFLLNE